MKIRIAYTDAERGKRDLLIYLVKRFYKGVKIREAAPKDGYNHTVLTIKESGNPNI